VQPTRATFLIPEPIEQMSTQSDNTDIEKLVGQLNANYATWIATQLKTNPTADCKKRIALRWMDRFDCNDITI